MLGAADLVGELGADRSSREVEQTLRTVGLVPPSRAFLERRFKQMAGEIAEERDRCARFSVRMSEPAEDPEQATAAPRRTGLVSQGNPHSARSGSHPPRLVPG